MKNSSVAIKVFHNLKCKILVLKDDLSLWDFIIIKSYNSKQNPFCDIRHERGYMKPKLDPMSSMPDVSSFSFVELRTKPKHEGIFSIEMGVREPDNMVFTFVKCNGYGELFSEYLNNKIINKNMSIEQTLGQKRVKAEFNPDKNELVDQLKNKSAELIDLLESSRGINSTGEKQRIISIAQTEIETACMYAVKSCFTN